MSWNVALRRQADFSEADRAAVGALGRRSWDGSSEPDARYPRGITWSHPTWFVRVRDPIDGRQLRVDRSRLLGTC